MLALHVEVCETRARLAAKDLLHVHPPMCAAHHLQHLSQSLSCHINGINGAQVMCRIITLASGLRDATISVRLASCVSSTQSILFSRAKSAHLRPPAPRQGA